MRISTTICLAAAAGALAAPMHGKGQPTSSEPASGSSSASSPIGRERSMSIPNIQVNLPSSASSSIFSPFAAVKNVILSQYAKSSSKSNLLREALLAEEANRNNLRWTEYKRGKAEAIKDKYDSLYAAFLKGTIASEYKDFAPLQELRKAYAKQIHQDREDEIRQMEKEMEHRQMKGLTPQDHTSLDHSLELFKEPWVQGMYANLSREALKPEWDGPTGRDFLVFIHSEISNYLTLMLEKYADNYKVVQRGTYLSKLNQAILQKLGNADNYSETSQAQLYSDDEEAKEGERSPTGSLDEQMDDMFTDLTLDKLADVQFFGSKSKGSR